MEIGRNIQYDFDSNRYTIALRYNFETTIRRWHFDTHRKAMRKFNQLRKQGAIYFDVYEDVTL